MKLGNKYYLMVQNNCNLLNKNKQIISTIQTENNSSHNNNESNNNQIINKNEIHNSLNNNLNYEIIIFHLLNLYNIF